jgi:hypothetical protein
MVDALVDDLQAHVDRRASTRSDALPV